MEFNVIFIDPMVYPAGGKFTVIILADLHRLLYFARKSREHFSYACQGKLPPNPHPQFRLVFANGAITKESSVDQHQPAGPSITSAKCGEQEFDDFSPFSGLQNFFSEHRLEHLLVGHQICDHRLDLALLLLVCTHTPETRNIYPVKFLPPMAGCDFRNPKLATGLFDTCSAFDSAKRPLKIVGGNVASLTARTEIRPR